MKRKRLISNIIICFFLGLTAVVWLFPLIMALINSFKTNSELLTNVMSLPSSIHFDNYFKTIEKMHYLRSLGNTVFVAALSVLMIILFSALAGWRLCRTKTKLSSFLFGLFIFSMIIPS